ncbi:DUF1761 domain-containing protein [Demequina sp.]|uniref:DUF1761 domain-containing protein n=1 Tax=Demequina sp. TaxID=2050685 RepID=UPI003D117F79
MEWFDLSDVRWVGVIVASLAAFLVGFLWFHERALGRAWARLAGVDLAGQRDGMVRRLVIGFVVTLVTVLLLNVLMAQLLVTTVVGGLVFGAAVGLVMRLLNHLFHDSFENRPAGLTVINGGHDVAALAVAGAVLGAFL